MIGDIGRARLLTGRNSMRNFVRLTARVDTDLGNCAQSPSGGGVNALPLPKNRRPNPHDISALFDGDGEVIRHPHAEEDGVIMENTSATFTDKSNSQRSHRLKIRPTSLRILIVGKNCHKTLYAETGRKSFAGAQSIRELFRGKSTLIFIRSDINLQEYSLSLVVADSLPRDQFKGLERVHRLNHITQTHGVPNLIALQRADHVKLSISRQMWSLLFYLLKIVLTEHDG